MFALLSGDPPFIDDDIFAMYEVIKKADFSFDAPIWSKISEPAKDLIRKLLVVDPEQRLSGQAIIAHPWISESPISIVEEVGGGFSSALEIKTLNK